MAAVSPAPGTVAEIQFTIAGGNGELGGRAAAIGRTRPAGRQYGALGQLHCRELPPFGRFATRIAVVNALQSVD
jgi:hypothetical protein